MQNHLVKTVLFGRGKWGIKLKSQLKKKTNLIKVFDSKSNMNEFNFSNIDWAIVATENKIHFKIVKFLLQKKINVFCEKPLTLNLNQSKKLIELSYKKKVQLYIDHIYEFKNFRIRLKKQNYIYRSKSSIKNFRNILYDLAYHDFYLINSKLKIKKYKISYLSFMNNELNFKLNLNNMIFSFNYNLNSKKSHYINQTNFIDRKNYINKMFSEVFNGKVDLKKNHSDALICNKLIDEIILFKKK